MGGWVGRWVGGCGSWVGVVAGRLRWGMRRPCQGSGFRVSGSGFRLEWGMRRPCQRSRPPPHQSRPPSPEVPCLQEVPCLGYLETLHACHMSMRRRIHACHMRVLGTSRRFKASKCR